MLNCVSRIYVADPSDRMLENRIYAAAKELHAERKILQSPADGGRITTKPYISSSSYILRMSNYKKGPWCRIWDGLYWRFLSRHRDLLAKNPRMRLAISHLDRMDRGLMRNHLAAAEEYLHRLS